MDFISEYVFKVLNVDFYLTKIRFGLMLLNLYKYMYFCFFFFFFSNDKINPATQLFFG